MRVFKFKVFVRFAKKSGISDLVLSKAVQQAEKGQIDADLGSGLIKQRVARKGQGKSGGFRTIIAYKTKSRAFFLYGFAKNDVDNIDDNQLESLKLLAKGWIRADDYELKQAILKGILEEVSYDKKK